MGNISKKNLKKAFLVLIFFLIGLGTQNNYLILSTGENLAENDLIFIDNENKFIFGADLSSYLEIKEFGGHYHRNATQAELLSILTSIGFNFGRIRLWNNPTNGYCDLEHTVQMAKYFINAKWNYILDFHYSDSWADPGQQIKPSNWSELSFKDLKQAIYNYTYIVMNQLKEENALPTMVQIGNEIDSGILWPDGHLLGVDSEEEWTNLAELLKEGIRAVNIFSKPESPISIIIHIAKGGDNVGSRWFIDNILAKNVSFDVIGLSYYSWWHGLLTDFSSNVNDLATRYGKSILIAETAYPWDLGWNDSTHNFVGDNTTLLSDYLPTAQGQRDYYDFLIDIVAQIPNKKGLGIILWEPAWIAGFGTGSPIENLALFNYEYNLHSVYDRPLILRSVQTTENSDTINSIPAYPIIIFMSFMILAFSLLISKFKSKT